MIGLTQITPPAVEPLTLAEAKLHLRVDHTADDSLITALIVAARQSAESTTGRSLITQQWRLSLDTWPTDGEIRLPRPALVSVQEISHLDAAGTRQTLDPSAYQLLIDTPVGEVWPAYGTAWPTCRDTPGSIRIDYTAGYGAAAAVPQSIKAWMLLAIGTWYAQREAISEGARLEIPRAFWAGLLDPYTIIQF